MIEACPSPRRHVGKAPGLVPAPSSGRLEGARGPIDGQRLLTLDKGPCSCGIGSNRT